MLLKGLYPKKITRTGIGLRGAGVRGMGWDLMLLISQGFC